MSNKPKATAAGKGGKIDLKIDLNKIFTLDEVKASPGLVNKDNVHFQRNEVLEYLMKEVYHITIGRNARKEDMAKNLKDNVFTNRKPWTPGRKLYRKHADKVANDKKNGTGYFGSGGGNTGAKKVKNGNKNADNAVLDDPPAAGAAAFTNNNDGSSCEKEELVVTQMKNLTVSSQVAETKRNDEKIIDELRREKDELRRENEYLEKKSQKDLEKKNQQLKVLRKKNRQLETEKEELVRENKVLDIKLQAAKRDYERYQLFHKETVDVFRSLKP